MRALTTIGEVGLEHPDGRTVLMRPSLYAMSSLGTPEEIVAKFAAIHSAPTLMTFDASDAPGVVLAGMQVNRQRVRDHWRQSLFLAREIMGACTEQDLAPFIGEYGERYNSYRMGPVPVEAMIVIARSLMQHGVIGPMPKPRGDDEPRQKSDYTPGFDALTFVSKAIAHLGMSEAEAWNMTMSSFAAHWHAKFGEQKEQRHSAEHDDTMRWLQAVNKEREKQKA